MRGWHAVLVSTTLAMLAGGAAWADQALLEAVQTGDRAAAIRLIDAGADANGADPLGTTALMWAARYADAELVDRLIRAGADVAAENEFGVTPLSEAALVGSAPVIARLLEAGVDPNAANPEGETALMLVARTGRLDAAQVLLDAGADVDAREHWGGQTTLMWAVAQLQPAMIDLLLAHGADVDARSTVRDWERKVSGEPRPKTLTQGGVTPLLFAARTGCIECAERLLAAGADIDGPDPYNVTPLIVAILNLQNDFAAYLIDAGADIDHWDLFGRTPLFLAVDMAHFSALESPRSPMAGLALAERLLERGANPNPQLKHYRPPFVRQARGEDNTLTAGATPLLRAAHAGDLPAVELLLRYDALVDLPNASGITPLMAAAGLGVSPFTTRARGKTQEGAIEVARRLLEAGADVNRQSFDPRRLHTEPGVREQMFGTVFQMSFRYAYLQPSGRTALHGAAQKGWNEMVRFLVDNGARLDVVDSTGRTPWDMARGDYELAITEPPPDPLVETLELLEGLCREAADCDLAVLVGDAAETETDLVSLR